ncbi:ferredoxin family protein [Marinilabiliaceae bacterium JC017]|nr:ferredoxin family protein [Marinilabiliaceae bacterium JC017]
MPNLKKIMSKQVYICGCEKDGKIEKATVEKLKKSLEEKNIGYTYIEDLCGSVLKNPEDLQGMCHAEDAMLIGCQPRAMEKLLSLLGDSGANTKLTFQHIDKADEMVSNITAGQAVTGDAKISYREEWKPWYPVIDYDRCNGCRKCLNFCLFGVYAVNEEGKVVVDQPANCKDMCPACARVCPQEAIIFPKHTDNTIDGSDGISGKKSGVNLIDQIQNEDVYSVLNARRSNFKMSLLKKDQLKMAEEERRICSCHAAAKKVDEASSEKNDKTGHSCCE